MYRKLFSHLVSFVALLVGCIWSLYFEAVGAPPLDRLRYIVETDAGGDPDDEQSLVRFLLYVNEWDVEGIIANRPEARPGENLNPERTGLEIVRRVIKAYAQCYTNLAQHDARYPQPAYLMQRTVSGYPNADEGVTLILSALESDDPRPLWFSNWGTDHGSGESCLKRALDRIRRERGQEVYARLKSRIRLSSADAFGDHTSHLTPPWTLWVDTYRPEVLGQRWYHRFSALTARAGGFDIETDVRTGHSPLGALYPTNTTHPQKEGDTMSFLYLVPNGLGDPEEPGWGSWAGRYGVQDDSGRPYYWASESDRWRESTNRENTLARWAVHLQNDFKARMDWCVRPFAKANHPPQIVLEGASRYPVMRLNANPGTEIVLDAGASSDPDGDTLSFEWLIYPEPGTYQGPIALTSSGSAARVHVPTDAAGKNIHVLAVVTDSGQPQLTRYARVVIQVRGRQHDWNGIEKFSAPPKEFANASASYRSPLIFKDGAKVSAAADWPRRKKEIAQDWNAVMGQWPALLLKPNLEVISAQPRDGLWQQRVRVEIAPHQTSLAWLLTPNSIGPAPAVLVVYYEPETSIGWGKEPWRDFGLQLAKRGFVTLSIGTPGGNAWKPDIGSAQCQPLSFHAYVAANCWQILANLPSVDSNRIGIVGHSYGGKWALFAGALWEKFAAVAVSDPGIVFDETRENVNYWEPWYLGKNPDLRRNPGIPTTTNPRTGAYKVLVEQGHDLHELHALIAPRPFFVSGGSEDPPERWLALNHVVTLNTMLGFSKRVFMSSRPNHAPTFESNESLYEFFEYFLQP